MPESARDVERKCADDASIRGQIIYILPGLRPRSVYTSRGTLTRRGARLILWRLQNRRTFEDPRGRGTEDEAANVGQVCHTTSLDVSHCAGMKKLSEEPESD